MKNLFVSMLILIMAACQSSLKNNPEQVASNQVKNPNRTDSFRVNTATTEIINDNCVIFLWPDDAGNDSIKDGIEGNDEVMLDRTWYPGIVSEMLDSFKIKHIDTEKEFVLLKNGKKLLKLKRKELEGDMILFRIGREPLITSSVDFNREQILRFFGK